MMILPQIHVLNPYKNGIAGAFLDLVSARWSGVCDGAVTGALRDGLDPRSDLRFPPRHDVSRILTGSSGSLSRWADSRALDGH